MAWENEDDTDDIADLKTEPMRGFGYFCCTVRRAIGQSTNRQFSRRGLAREGVTESVPWGIDAQGIADTVVSCSCISLKGLVRAVRICPENSVVDTANLRLNNTFFGIVFNPGAADFKYCIQGIR